MAGRDSIGTLAQATGTKVQTIRYYEQIGLMPAPYRTAGGQRRYDRHHRDRLAFIRHSRALGFALPQIRSLLALADGERDACDDIHAVAEANLAAVRRRLAQLQALEAELARMVAECQGGHPASCRVVEVLADHSQCRHDHAGPA